MKKSLLLALMLNIYSSQVLAFNIVLDKKLAVNPDTGAIVSETPSAEVAKSLNAFTTTPVVATTTIQIWPWDKISVATNAGGCNPTYSWADGNLNQAEAWMVENCTQALVKADGDLNNAYQRIKSQQILSKTTPNLFTDRWFRGWVAERDENILKAIASGMPNADIKIALAAFYLKRVNLIASEM